MGDANLKIVIIGDGTVGKTTLLETFRTGQFEDVYTPTVFDRHESNMSVNGREITLTLIDTAGQESFDRLRPLSYVDTDGFIVAFSLCDHETFKDAKAKWVPEIMNFDTLSPFICVGTKNDLKKKGKSHSWYDKECRKMGAYAYIDTSSKQSYHVDDAIQLVAQAALDKKDGKIKKRYNKAAKPTLGGEKKPGGCVMM